MNYKYIFIFLLFYINLLADVNNTNKKNNFITNNQSIADIFMQCANQNPKACNSVLQHGFINDNLCEANECAIIGATLSFANRENEAIPYLKKSCGLGIIASCTHLAIIYQNQDRLSNSIMYYEIACNNSDNIACYNLGILYARKNTQYYNPNHAIRFFQKSCNTMFPQSCFNIAVLYATMENNRDLSNAKFYFDKACDLGMAKSCLKLKELNNANIPMPIPEKRRGLYVNKNQ